MTKRFRQILTVFCVEPIHHRTMIFQKVAAMERDDLITVMEEKNIFSCLVSGKFYIKFPKIGCITYGETIYSNLRNNCFVFLA